MGFSIGGMFKSLVNPATLMQLAMGPAGWASIAVKMIGSAVAQQAIQMIGEKLGLPQSVIGMAQNAFSAATGTQGMSRNISEAVSQFADMANLSPREEGQMQRTAADAYRSLVNSLVESDEFKSAKSGGKGGESIFMRIASALGKLADEKMNEMASLAEQIGGTKDGTKQNQITELTGKMQAKGQEFGLISNAMTNVLKSIGEGASTIARKG